MLREDACCEQCVTLLLVVLMDGADAGVTKECHLVRSIGIDPNGVAAKQRTATVACFRSDAAVTVIGRAGRVCRFGPYPSWTSSQSARLRSSNVGFFIP